MVIKPEECREGIESFEAAVTTYTNTIDAYLKSHWYRDCPGLQVPVPKVTTLHGAILVRSEAIKRYEKAGWNVKYETSCDPRDNYSEAWLLFKQK